MGNPLYNQTQNNPIAELVSQIQNFSKTIQGDPKQIIQNMLNNGQLSQADFNKYAQMAQQIMPFMQ